MFILSDYADVAGDFSTLIGEANFFSSAWLADLKSKSDEMRKLRDDFRKLSPPSEYRAFHRRADQAFTKAVEGGQLFYEGARDLDVTKIERATELVIEAAELMDEANDLIPSSS